jgi:ankyrin repeat protein
MMRRLMELGADLEAVAGSGLTALAAAAVAGQVAALEALLGMGASVNGGETPALCTAAVTGQVAAAEVLLSAGADVTATMTKGRFQGETAAEMAAQMQHTAIVELLARHSAQ